MGDMGVVHILVADEGVVCIDPVEVHELMLEVVHEKVVKNNHLRQQYKTLLLVLEIINDKVYNNFFMDDYDEWKNAEALFLGLQVPKHTKFYWKCLNTFKELNFWHKYLIDIVTSTNEDRLQFLETMTGVSRNNEDIPKQLGLGQSYQNQHFGRLSFGNPSFVGKKYGGQISPCLCGHDF